MSPRRRPPLSSLIRNLLAHPLPGTGAVMEDLAAALDSAVRADAHAILRLDPGGGTARVLAGKGLRFDQQNGTGSIESPGIAALVSGCGSGQVKAAGGPFDNDPFLEGEAAVDLLLASMDFGVERLAALAIRRRQEKFTPSEKERFLVISGVTSLMISCSYDAQDQGRQRDIDPVTGLGFYNAFQDTLDKEISRSRRRSGKITICIIAVEGEEGPEDVEPVPSDSTLLLVADTIVNQLRNFDTVIRYSPAEFALVLPDMGGEDAENVLRRVLDAFTSSNGDKVPCLYAGFSCYPEDGSTAERLIETAEAALNLAKETGPMAVSRWREG